MFHPAAPETVALLIRIAAVRQGACVFLQAGGNDEIGERG